MKQPPTIGKFHMQLLYQRHPSYTRDSGWWLLLVGVLLCCVAGMVVAQETRSLEAILADMAHEIAQRFPKVSGEVVKVEGEQVYLSLGAQDQLLEGTQLTLFREGEVLQQPSTGAPLGRLEEELGFVVVERVAERYAVARLLPPATASTIHQGDKVRITAGPIALGVLPTANLMQRDVPRGLLTTEIQRALEATGRFRIIPANRILLWSYERQIPIDKDISPDMLFQLAGELHFDFALLPLLKDVNGKTSLELRLLSPTQRRLIAMTSGYVPDTAFERRVTTAPAPSRVPVPTPQVSQAPTPSVPVPTPQVSQVPTLSVPVPTPQVSQAPAAPVPAPAPQGQQAPAPSARSAPPPRRPLFKARQPERAQPASLEWNLSEALTELRKLPAVIYGMDAGDIDGDGKAEVVMAIAEEILLYQLEGEQLVLRDTFRVKQAGKVLAVQLLRFGPQPTIAVIVNRQAPRADPDGFVLLVRNQRLVLWQGHISDILLAVDTDGDGVNDSVWGQPFDSRHFFTASAVVQYRISDAGFQPGEHLALPGAFRATGAALAQLRPDGPRNLVFIDSRRQLRVFSGGDQIWRSRESVGGSYTYAELEHIMSRDPMVEQFFFQPIPAAVDVDGDGLEEVLGARNDSRLGFIPNLSQFSGGDIVVLRADNFGFNFSSITPQFDGVVSGIAVVRGETPGVLVAVSRAKGLFSNKGETSLFFSRFQPVGVQ